MTLLSPNRLDRPARDKAVGCVVSLLADQKVSWREWPKSEDSATSLVRSAIENWDDDFDGDKTEMLRRTLTLLRSDAMPAKPPGRRREFPYGIASVLATVLAVPVAFAIMLMVVLANDLSGISRLWMVAPFLALLSPAAAIAAVRERIPQRRTQEEEEYRRGWPFASAAELFDEFSRQNPGDDALAHFPGLAARRQAAGLLEALQCGRMELAEVLRKWPTSAWDSAIEGIRTNLLLPLARKQEHRTVEAHADVISRCRRFLHTDLPYAWGVMFRESWFITILWLAVACAGGVAAYRPGNIPSVILSVVIALVIGIAGCWLSAWRSRRMRLKVVCRDSLSWPFADAESAVVGLERAARPQ